MSLLLFSNLFPSSVLPSHARFIKERSDRLAASLGLEYQVIHPLPRYPRLPGRSVAARHSQLPSSEVFEGVKVWYPRYFHIPRSSQRRQARRMERACRSCFAKIVKDSSPKLVDAQYLYPDAFAALPLAREHGIACVVTARGSDVQLLKSDPALRAQARRILPAADKIMAVSKDLARELAAILGLDAGEIELCPNGVDLDVFRPGCSPACDRVVALGRLVAGKAVGLLIEALATEPGRAIPSLVLIGDGPQHKALQALATRLGVSQRVQFLGSLDQQQVAAELAKGGVLAFPSRSEGWPNAVLEALASGLPVLASDLASLGEMLDIERNPAVAGLLPLSADPEDWALALLPKLEHLRREPELLRAQARALAQPRSWDHAIQEIARIFRELL